MSQSEFKPQIAVVGLGYVGLPLAVALSKREQVIGFDIDESRVGELRDNHDRTRELSEEDLAASNLVLTSSSDDMKEAEVFIVTVPTPVDTQNAPDLGAVKAASKTVGGVISKGAVVVFESTVFPGVTEEICGPILEQESGLSAGNDFILGYSPERINPGDKVHTVDKITKIVAAQTPAAARRLADLYGAMNGGRIHIAPDIKTAEASKVIENAQRDINIAFINEIALIFEQMGISVYDVLDAAKTKWNFLDFRPGLVGGHCIGVDPYYLSHAAQRIGYDPDVILAGRKINDGMGATVAGRIHENLGIERARILVLGITFKENVPDIRNSKVADVVNALQALGHAVAVYDPLADGGETRREYGVSPIEQIDGPYDPLADGGETRREYGVSPIEQIDGPYDAVVGAVPHAAFSSLDLADIVTPGGLVADIKGMWRGKPLPDGLRYWSL